MIQGALRPPRFVGLFATSDPARLDGRKGGGGRRGHARRYRCASRAGGRGDRCLCRRHHRVHQLEPAAFDAGIPSNPADDPPVDPNIRTMWAVDGANQLVRFTADAPGMVTARALEGLASGERGMGIDIRPADGKLYAVGSTSGLCVVDRKTNLRLDPATGGAVNDGMLALAKGDVNEG